MSRQWWTRFVLFLFIFLSSVYFLVPTFFSKTSNSVFSDKKLNLGLDLQGGIYLVLGIDFDDVFQKQVRLQVERAIGYLEDQGVGASLGSKDFSESSDPKYWIELDGGVDTERAIGIVRESYRATLRLTDEENAGRLQYGLNRGFLEDKKQTTVERAIEVIRNRIDEFGVTEPEITSLGTDRIVVQLPGVKDILGAKELIGRTAKLEFKLVSDKLGYPELKSLIDKATSEGIVLSEKVPYSTYVKQLNQNLIDKLPKDTVINFNKTVTADNKIELGVPYLLDEKAQVTGEDIADAFVTYDQNQQPVVSLEMKPSGKAAFGKVTTDHVGSLLAIVLDGNVYSAPSIRQPILNGQAQISVGGGSYKNMLDEAKEISMVLRAGALPVDLDFQEQRIVGPSLGAESISKARTATLIGALLVILFILFYYRFAGLLANLTLGLNVIIVLACLVGLDATLTLPGIAGIALTIGMAIDANIIIYERIKEELRRGVQQYQAVEAGFNRAFWTILDANLTTGVAGLCLLNFGTGPIRGFAVTLLIGIFATIYSSYFAGQLFFQFYLERKRTTSDLSIGLRSKT